MYSMLSSGLDKTTFKMQQTEGGEYREKKRVKHERKSEFLFSMVSDFTIFHEFHGAACMCMQYRLQ